MEIIYIVVLAILIFFLAIGYLVLSTVLIENHKLKYKQNNFISSMVKLFFALLALNDKI